MNVTALTEKIPLNVISDNNYLTAYLAYLS